MSDMKIRYHTPPITDGRNRWVKGQKDLFERVPTLHQPRQWDMSAQTNSPDANRPVFRTMPAVALQQSRSCIANFEVFNRARYPFQRNMAQPNIKQAYWSTTYRRGSSVTPLSIAEGSVASDCCVICQSCRSGSHSPTGALVDRKTWKEKTRK